MIGAFLSNATGWRGDVANAVDRLEWIANRMAISLVPSHDFAELVEFRKLAGVEVPLNPRYDHARSRLGPRNAVWVKGVTAFVGVSTQAIRMYDWHCGATLATESRALRTYYDDPADAEHRDHSLIHPPIADRIHGRVAYNGAVWVADKYRGARSEIGGARVSQIVSSLSRLLAVALYDAEWCIATTPKAHFLKGISERYGWAGIETPSAPERIGDMSNDVCLMWSRREDVIEEARRIYLHGLSPPEEARVVPAA